MTERRVFGGFGNGRKFKTGKYVYDSKLKKLVRLSERASESTCQSPLIIPDIQEFVTDNINGEPTVIHGRRQKKALMKQHGVVEYEPTMKDKRDEHREESERIIANAKQNLGMQDNLGKGWQAQRNIS